MSFDQDPNEQANISGADLAILIDELKEAQAALALIACIAKSTTTENQLQKIERIARAERAPQHADGSAPINAT